MRIDVAGCLVLNNETNLDPEWLAALRVANVLIERGHKTYLVGGCVRDMLLGRRPKDYDIVTSAKPDEIESLFRKSVDVGKSFGVIQVLEGAYSFDVATFRSDGSYSDHRHPDTITYGNEFDDVGRRDFTINALLLDPLSMRVIDHVGGLRDMAGCIVRTVGDPIERYTEDPLRILRLVRLTAELHFDGSNIVDDPSVAKAAPGLVFVSRERITSELAKTWRVAEGADWVIAALSSIDRAMRKVSDANTIFPLGLIDHPTIAAQWIACNSFQAPSIHHELLKWALCVKECSDPEAELRELYRLTNETVKGVMQLLRSTLVISDPETLATARGIELIMDRSVPYRAWLWGHMAHLNRVDSVAYDRSRDAEMLFVATGIDLSLRPLPVDQIPSGADMIAAGVKPGPAMGRMLRSARDAILERRCTTKAEAMLHALEGVRHK